MTDTTQPFIDRFSERVDHYVKYRPGYPSALVREMLALTGLQANATVADLGCGSGIFSRLLLAQGLRVIGVEPSARMRLAAERDLAEWVNFRSIGANAEHTTLEHNSVALITAAQSFHWFNTDRARIEFQRILKPGGQLALIWNRRKLSQPLQQAYDALLREMAPAYDRANHMNLGDDDIARNFAAGKMQIKTFANNQRLNLSGLLGRLESSSYCPAADSPEFFHLTNALTSLFNKYARNGYIDFAYDTKLFLGPIARSV